jgi:hypothetical protein
MLVTRFEDRSAGGALLKYSPGAEVTPGAARRIRQPRPCRWHQCLARGLVQAQTRR